MAQSEIENADQCDNILNGASNSASWFSLFYTSNSSPDVSSMDFTTAISGAFTGTTYNSSTNVCSGQCTIYRRVRSEKNHNSPQGFQLSPPLITFLKFDSSKYFETKYKGPATQVCVRGGVNISHSRMTKTCWDTLLREYIKIPNKVKTKADKIHW